ncbi:hypothetical protein NBCG_01949 [Nocardioidaceae bacterium Broad-1]|uniref:hypothetical protein n=1 Tax=Nocardioides luteus TaxID=1844 RepID=UPI000202937E|nr:hypothetical protein [Nocardioides luteus]EGD43822.1 hypothetical protein NBCG_01949 [Nocardioidaceae bacterium Broad-1]MBG6095576.1 hypothetical protein [Nocardioides luteus]
MIALAAEPASETNLGGLLLVIVIIGVFWMIQDLSKKARARSEHLRAKRSLTSSQRKALARINRSAKAHNGSKKDLWEQFAAFKGNPKAFGKEAASLYKTYKAKSKKK